MDPVENSAPGSQGALLCQHDKLLNFMEVPPESLFQHHGSPWARYPSSSCTTSHRFIFNFSLSFSVTWRTSAPPSSTTSRKAMFDLQTLPYPTDKAKIASIFNFLLGRASQCPTVISIHSQNTELDGVISHRRRPLA